MTKDHDRRLRVANQTGNEADDLCRVVCRDSLTLMVGMGRAAQSRDDEDMIGTRLTQVPTKRRKYWTSKKAGDVQRSIAGLLRSCLEASDFSPGRSTIFLLQPRCQTLTLFRHCLTGLRRSEIGMSISKLRPP